MFICVWFISFITDLTTCLINCLLWSSRSTESRTRSMLKHSCAKELIMLHSEEGIAEAKCQTATNELTNGPLKNQLPVCNRQTWWEPNQQVFEDLLLKAQRSWGHSTQRTIWPHTNLHSNNYYFTDPTLCASIFWNQVGKENDQGHCFLCSPFHWIQFIILHSLGISVKYHICGLDVHITNVWFVKFH